ncbi:protease inhibitor I9 family protein, partial [Streptomyces sp. ME02-6991-2B]|nr:protease inhibitor I9 family protein [Streptomyces sp. ME02-6991-2B]
MRPSFRRTASAALIAALPVLAPAGPPPSAAQPRTAPPGVISDQYIVTLEPGAAPQTVLDGLGVQPLFTYRYALRGFAARLTPAQAQRVRAAPGVDEVELQGSTGAQLCVFREGQTGVVAAHGFGKSAAYEY